MDPPSSSSSQVNCVLRLDTQTSGWDKSMHKLFKGIRDVTYTIDATRGLAYLSGKISPEIILRISKAKKHAQLIHLDYGHIPPPPPPPPPLPYMPDFPYEFVPVGYNYPESPPQPMYQPTAPPYMYYRQNPYNEQQLPMASPYYYNPYYGEIPYFPPPQFPTRDPITGEPQCRIL